MSKPKPAPYRLPVQHPQFPHCPRCGRDLPNYNAMRLDIPDDVNVTVLRIEIAFIVQCKCGLELQLSKTCNGIS